MTHPQKNSLNSLNSFSTDEIKWPDFSKDMKVVLNWETCEIEAIAVTLGDMLYIVQLRRNEQND